MHALRIHTPSLTDLTRPTRTSRSPMLRTACTPRASSAAVGVAVGAAGAWALYYVLRCRLHPKIRAGQTALNASLLERLPSLRTPYQPPIWAFNGYIQLVIYLLRQKAAKASRILFRREAVACPDGGETALDWYEPPGMAQLPATAPILLLLHTITGNSRDFADIAEIAAAIGWRAVVLLRRGHLGTPLSAPRFNLLGCTADMRQQVALIREQFPAAPLLAVGSSAGTGLLVRYLGEEGAAAPIAAAVCICPGYDTGPGKAFSRFVPLVDKHILSAVKKFFLRRQNDAMLAAVPGYAACRAAATIAAFQAHAFALEGYPTAEEMYHRTNPMGVAHDIRTPICVFNAEDDPVCSVQNVRENAALFDSPQDRILVLTERGSHCCYWEGLLSIKGSWVDRVACEYLAAVLALRAEEKAAATAPPLTAAAAAAAS